MDRYQCFKSVKAAKIVDVTGPHDEAGLLFDLILQTRRGPEVVRVERGWIQRHLDSMSSASIEGCYLVEYEDGYRSISPAPRRP